MSLRCRRGRTRRHRDPEAIDIMSAAYFNGGCTIKPMLDTMFRSDFFKSESVWYEKVKSPAELVAGVLRLTGEHRTFSPAIQEDANAMGLMGQTLVNPPSVEGWHWGDEWIDTGNLVERINFASEHFSKDATTGIADTVDADIAAAGGTVPPQELVERLSRPDGRDPHHGDLSEFAGRARGP